MSARKAPRVRTVRRAAPGRSAPPRRRRRAAGVRALAAREVRALRAEIERRVAEATPRWNADPEEVQRSVARLVLSLVEFVRRLFERQAIRRMEAGTLSAAETEALGLSLMRLEETVHDLARRFGLDPQDLNLDLGPLGRLH